MKRFLVPLALLSLAACSQITPAPSTELAPTTFGTSTYDYAYKLAKHSSGVYAGGYTEGNLHATQKGGGDAVIRKYDAGGGLIWGKQFGTPQQDYVQGVASDSSNNAYVLGVTYGSLAGSRGQSDMFLRKFNSGGTAIWTKQFGGSSFDYAADVAVAGSNVYVAGTLTNSTTNDYSIYLAKYNSSGTQVWSKTFGTSTTDYAFDIATDSSGNAYVVGYTYGSLSGTNGGGSDMFIRKYSGSGTVVWTKQFNYSNSDVAQAISINGSNIYVVGQFYYNASTSTDLDVRLIKLTTGGSLVYSYGYGSSLDQFISDVSATSSGFFISAYEYDRGGDYGGFVTKFSGSGSAQWAAYQDSSGYDFSYAVLARSSSEVYVAGGTAGVLGSANNGSVDAFLRRLNGSSGSTVWTDQ